MKLLVKKSLVLAVIAKKYGGVEKFISNWEQQVALGRIKAHKTKESATIYRWLDKGLPANADDVFGFFGALDLDIASVIDVESSGILKNFSIFRIAFLTGETSSLAPLKKMYKPSPIWPSNDLAERFYARKWSTFEFNHVPNGVRNVYALLKIRITANVTSDHPIAFHIAYRRRGALDKMWRPYGVIIRFQNSTTLLSESGDFQVKQDQGDFKCVQAETYFGPSSVEFKLASLHSFKCDVETPSVAEGVVRFHGI